MNSLALVTGATGFLGKYVLRQWVARGDRARVLVRRAESEFTDLGAEVVLGDIRDRDVVTQACEGVDVVIHVAGLAGYWGKWCDYHAVNVLGTRNILHGCRVHGVGRLVYTSSPSVTFDGRDQCGVDESVPYPRRWLCHYSHSKAMAEQEILSANGTGELRTCALRPHLIWGPGDRHLTVRLLSRARAGKLRKIGPGTNRIDTVYVENAAAAHLQAADALAAGRAAGQAYFISQGEPVGCWQWIDRLLQLDGLPPVGRSISLAGAWGLGAVCELLFRWLPLRAEPPMTRFVALQLARSHYFDIGRARTDLGYEPTVSTEEGLRRLANSLSNR